MPTRFANEVGTLWTEGRVWIGHELRALAAPVRGRQGWTQTDVEGPSLQDLPTPFTRRMNNEWRWEKNQLHLWRVVLEVVSGKKIYGGRF